MTLTKDPTPLYVDLDGTVIASDLVWESLVELARRQPLQLLLVPVWILRGRAHLKRQVARRVRVDVIHLPYRPIVLEHLHHRRSAGQPLILATASDESLARDVADHLAIFADTIGSDGHTNRRSHAKLAAIRARENSRPFDYAGDSRADLPLWRAARRCLMVLSSDSLLEQLAAERAAKDTVVFSVPPQSWWRLAELHPGRILKSCPEALAALFPGFINPSAIVPILAVTLGLVAASTATAVLAAIARIPDDRRDPNRSSRPLACGHVKIPTALRCAGVLSALALVAALAGSFWTLALMIVWMLIEMSMPVAPLRQTPFRAAAVVVALAAGISVARPYAGAWGALLALPTVLIAAASRAWFARHSDPSNI